MLEPDVLETTASDTIAHAASCEKSGSRAVTVAVLRLRAAALVEAEEWVAAKPEREMIKRAAVRLCRLAKCGDPYEVTMGVADQGAILAAKKTVAFALPIRPQWMMFIDEACAAIHCESP